MSDGMTQPRCPLKLVFRGVRASIHEDLAPHMRAAFEIHVDALELRLLEHDHRIGSRIETGAAGRQAKSLRIVFGFVLGMVVVNGSRPRQEWNPRLGCRAATQSATTTS